MAPIKPLVIVDEVAHAELHEHLESIPSRYRAERIRTLAMMALRGETVESDRSPRSKKKAGAPAGAGNSKDKSSDNDKKSSTERAEESEVESSSQEPEPEQDPHQETRKSLISGVGDMW